MDRAVSGVRSWCEASCRNRRWVVSSRAFSSLTTSRSWSATSLRRACHTITQNIAAIRGTSFSSSIDWAPIRTSQAMAANVLTMTAPSTQSVGLTGQTRKP